ncbi:uncharacterized protein LOC124358556 [Homalodisca vitripennis]|uniref:uncharacterized protein LOC124358556 n=1 Tax=Homalodisca vitripennis TaxID=197043 RepID=UPI001EEC35FC|nr:uncharacterized protein LOC124358556 [Homalodisca vitripennis]
MLWEGYHMQPGGAQEEIEEVQADLRKRDGEAAANEAGTSCQPVVSEPQVADEGEGEVKPSDGVTQDPPKIDKEVHLMSADPESGRHKRQNILKLVSRIFLQAFTLTFLAEWGDRSQLTTILLAAREDIYGVMGGIRIVTDASAAQAHISPSTLTRRHSLVRAGALPAGDEAEQSERTRERYALFYSLDKGGEFPKEGLIDCFGG